MSNLDRALQEVSEQVVEVIDALLPRPQNGEARVIEAMRYSTLAPGKRLRPFLVVTSADMFGVSRKSSLMVAAAIEFVHTYSLVHDDLPAMDDDPMRRGQPSAHIKFDEATAILAGDGLLTLAFQTLVDDRIHADPSVRCELVKCFAEASGVHGMVGGQMMDLISADTEFSEDEVIRLQRLKTGELFALSCESGAILGKTPQRLRTALRNYAHSIGLAFQITDDLLDAEGVTRKQGKGTERGAFKPATLVGLLGTERAREQAEILSRQAKMHLEIFDKKSALMKELADFVVNRKR